MEYRTCSLITHVEPIINASTLWPLGYSMVPRRGYISRSRSEVMRNLSHSRPPNFSRLPTELILKICEHISVHDLWHNIRPTSRLLSACAREVLPRKAFHESRIYISWCCFWCSLGQYCLHTACNPIIWLFPDAKSVHVSLLSDRALLAKVIFGNLCNLVTGCKPKIRISLSEKEQDVWCESREIQQRLRPCTASQTQDLQLCQEEFLVWYFAKQKQQRARGRIVKYLEFAAHLLRFFATSVALLCIGLAFTLVVGVVIETYKLCGSIYRSAKSLVHFCLRKVLLWR
jgi:hypothetical protein